METVIQRRELEIYRFGSISHRSILNFHDELFHELTTMILIPFW